MSGPRKVEHHTKVRREKTYHGIASTNGGDEAAVGKTVYRDEYQRDHGPDLDEPLDGTESGIEFDQRVAW